MNEKPAASPHIRERKQKHSYFERDGLDFYTEPAWCTELLLSQCINFDWVWDPAAGLGTIPNTCINHGIAAWGTDIENRRGGLDRGRDFFDETELPTITCGADNVEVVAASTVDIVTNPPYRLAEAFVRHALELGARKVAVLVRLDFLASQKRHALFTEHPPSYVFVLSRRPSMPPGELLVSGEIKPKGGQHDFAWIVWDTYRPQYPTEMRWLK